MFKKIEFFNKFSKNEFLIFKSIYTHLRILYCRIQLANESLTNESQVELRSIATRKSNFCKSGKNYGHSRSTHFKCPNNKNNKKSNTIDRESAFNDFLTNFNPNLIPENSTVLNIKLSN